MFLVVALLHICYVFVTGAEVVSPLLEPLPELVDWFATTQTKEKKARTFVRKKALHQLW